MATRLAILQHPRWAAMDWMVHGFSTRTGGVSTVYRPDSKGELNLGFTPADARETVLQNRELLVRQLVPGDPDARLTTLSQIHSANIHRINTLEASPPPGDGLMTVTPGVYLAIQTADCVPVLLADTRQRVAAAFHAGWRGTVQRIVENGVARMREEFGSRPEDMTALIGPAIGPCCYAVGDDLRDNFAAQFSYAADLFWRSHLDLVEANRRQLLDGGLAASTVQVVGDCTSCHPDDYFSHRQSGGNTGRMMCVVGIRACGESAT